MNADTSILHHPISKTYMKPATKLCLQQDYLIQGIYLIILVIAILIYINEESKNYFYFLKCTSNYFRVLKDFFFSALYVGLRSNALQFSSLYSITV